MAGRESIRRAAARKGITVAQERKERNTARGLSPGAAVGHARPHEASARDLATVERDRNAASIDQLRKVALHVATKEVGDRPRFDGRALLRRVFSINDRKTLEEMIKADWSASASNQIPGNPYFYHGGDAKQ